MLPIYFCEEIIEQAVKAFAEEAGGYWLKIHHFLGCGEIDKGIFDQIKAKHIKEQREVAEFAELGEFLNKLDGLLGESNE